MRRVVLAVIALLIVGHAVVFLLVFSGPRMKTQSSLKTYEEVVDLPPEGSRPVTSPVPAIPGADRVAGMSSPIEDTAESRRRGRVYYGYYCQFCHGADGGSLGPVGQSFNPRPADLRSERVRAMSDGELYRAMLTGEGHAPVLPRVVPEEYRWYLVLHVRQLSEGREQAMAVEKAEPVAEETAPFAGVARSEPTEEVEASAIDPLWKMLIFLGLACAVAGLTVGASWALGERHQARTRDEPYESGVPPTGSARLRLSAKFYLMAMFFVIFDLESVFIFAYALVFRSLGWAGYVEMIVFIGVLVIALAYLWRQGALDWGTDWRRQRNKRRSEP